MSSSDTGISLSKFHMAGASEGISRTPSNLGLGEWRGNTVGDSNSSSSPTGLHDPFRIEKKSSIRLLSTGHTSLSSEKDNKKEKFRCTLMHKQWRRTSRSCQRQTHQIICTNGNIQLATITVFVPMMNSIACAIIQIDTRMSTITIW